MTVEIVPTSAAEAGVWGTALEVSQLFAGIPWLLIGAQMVMLLEREAGRGSTRTTADVDVMVDVRALAGGARSAAARLTAAGYRSGSAEHPYRFIRDRSQVDLVAPDHLGPHVDLTTIPPASTMEIPGGSRAIATRRDVEVRVADVAVGILPVPSLAGAIILKVRAWEQRRADRDAEDVVRLLALIRDVEDIRAELKPSERRALRHVAPLSTDDRVWNVAGDTQDARAAFERLST